VTAAAAAPPLSLGAKEKIRPTARITPTADILLRSDQFLVKNKHYPLKLYAIHTGDALTKTMVMAVILGVWR